LDFSHEELVEVVERLVNGLLERAGVAEPPVDALHIAEVHLGIPVEVVESTEEDEIAPPAHFPGRGRARPRGRAGAPPRTPVRNRRRGVGLVLTADMTPAQRQKAAAESIARGLVPAVLHKLGLPPDAAHRPFVTHLCGLIVPRLLVPTRLLRSALRVQKFDVAALSREFATATTEAVALRLLDLEEPCVVSIVDDGVVTVRRSNRQAVGRKLGPAEQLCHDRVAELELPHRVRQGGWSVSGWFVPDRPFRRILLRASWDDTV
jgi:hypothetical protein